MTPEEKIKCLASPKWIKYIHCKKCYTDYDTEIATQPCLRCGGYEFEQFDLVLCRMPKLETNK